MTRLLVALRVTWLTAVTACLLTAPSVTAAQTSRNGASAAATDRTAPLKFGFSRDRLARIDAFLQSYVDSGRIGGATA